MYLKLSTRTGGGTHSLIPYIRFYRTIGIICAPVLKPQYEKFAKFLQLEHQIKLHVYDRSDYYGDTIIEHAQSTEYNFDAFLVDDYANALQFDMGSYPKLPMMVHMEEFFESKNIVLIVIE